MARVLRSKHLRSALYYLQGGKCAMCGKLLPDDWHADHVVPYSVSGRTNVHEMQALCPACNLAKGAKMLRKHQAAMKDISERIRTGISKADSIIVQVTPGGGKSALPMILSKEIAEPLGYKICWVVPRDALRRQAEKGFISKFMRGMIGHDGLIRASGNEARPARNTNGYVTTYQAIAAHPELHRQEFDLHNYILFLDECHHVPEKGTDEEAAYYQALSPLVNHPNCKLKVFASGTLERHDGNRIAFLPYKRAINADVVDLDANDTTEVIRYSRKDALEERAIVPLHFHVMDGNARWLNPITGEERNVESIAESAARDQGAVLRTILQTQYAYSLLDKCFDRWQDYKEAIYPKAKMLVIAPTIGVAKEYQQHLLLRNHAALIATSDDTPKAHKNIDRFKGVRKAGPEVDLLVTVGMAYEGLDVPQVTHVACLTNIRSRPWVEQSICRANRTDEGKTHGYIFIPDDPRMKSIVEAIEAEQAAVVVTWPKEKSTVGRKDGEQEIVQPEPIHGDVTRERAQGLEDGTHTGYDETETILQAMKHANMKAVSVIQVKQMMAFMGAGVVPNSNNPPNYENDDVLTPSELETKLRKSLTRAVNRAGNSDVETIIGIRKELKAKFGGVDTASVKSLQWMLKWVDEKYGGVTG